MDADIDTHSHPDEMMKAISNLGDSRSDDHMQFNRNMMQPQLNSMHQQGYRPDVKQESNFSHMSPSMHNQQNNNNYYGNQPNSYFQQQQNHNNMSGGYPQSPIPGSPMHQNQNPMNHMPIQTHHNQMQTPSPGIPQSPGPMLSDNQAFNSNNVNVGDLGSLSTPVLLEKIYKLQRSQKDDLNKIRQFQKQVMVSPNKQSFDILDQQHRQMKEQIDTEVKSLQRLYTQVILQPSEIHRLLLLVQELKIQQTQLELFHQELHQLTQPHGPTRCIATLVVSQEPFPMVITKGKQLDEDPVVVQLLCGANVEFQSFSQMKVAMVWENHQSKANNQKNIDCDTQTVDAFNRIAKWHLKFLNGTRKNSVTLRFGMQVQVSQPSAPVTVTVESHSTRPFIVITNECQWEESEGTLLKKDAFGEQPEIPWPQFANVLQRHFLRATRQDAITPTRCLSQTDFEYIHAKFFGNQASITPKSYGAFWAWFGKTIKKLRYQRHILPLWQTGLIHGFLSRDAVHQVLRNEDPGTFLVRFSERHAGQFAVAYRIDGNPDERVRHYLVQPDDTAGNKKTLPDFLSEQSAFCFLLSIGTENENGVKVYHKFRKESVLDSYLSKRSALPPAVGYDSDIITNYHSPMVQMDKELLDAE